jgi:hypothetical protein
VSTSWPCSQQSESALFADTPCAVRGGGSACDGVDAAWAGTERRRQAVASAGEEDERREATRCAQGRAAVAAAGGAGAGRHTSVDFNSLYIYDRRAHVKIEVQVEFVAGVEIKFWTSIFCNWTCKWDLEASTSICRP